MVGQAHGLRLPMFVSYYESPVKIVETPEGGAAAWRLATDGGSWLPANSLIDTILFGRDDNIDVLSRDEFIQLTEQERARHLEGSGPVHALYETVAAITDMQAREGRYPTSREIALVQGIRRKTFVMFEEQLQRAGVPGADPHLAEG
ncbi:hypothetical protein ACIG87_28315 [Micromonospora sp. NPDC051925]|uniref:hypothetical protein n=1 Tax=Micromonospora sp. NPDC051925 TaxID=3364288 RepID=UPI0037C9FB47